ncbi:MAG: hypothetical protein FWH48_08600, partial [Oscillospiraceae bacterium]|nr:hypothetical protein [Oscillospiraceae bacterium]
MKKTTVITIFLFMLLLSVSCRNNTETDDAPTTASPTSDTTQSMADMPELPIQDFGGYEFKFLWPEPISESHFIHNELWVEQENGENIDDAVYKRNLAVEEKYNIKISCDMQSFADIPNTISRMVSAGESSYDAFCTQIL